MDETGHHFDRTKCVFCGKCVDACLGEALTLFGRPVDIEEAYEAGAYAVRVAVEGKSDYMVGFERVSSVPYENKMVLIPLEKVANTEKKVPREWINEEGNFIKQEYIDYALPLIQTESNQPKEDGLPRFARLKKVLATK